MADFQPDKSISILDIGLESSQPPASVEVLLIQLHFFFDIYLFIWLLWVLVVACGIFAAACELLVAACGSSSLTRDRTRAPCIGSVEP